MKTILKFFIKPIYACITLIGCLFLGLIAFVLINPGAITKLAQDSIQKIVRQHTEDRVTLGVLHWGIFPLSIKAHNVCIQHPNLDKSIIFALESVQLKPDILRCLLGDYKGALSVQVNNTISLQATWTADAKELILNDTVFQYLMPKKQPIKLYGNFRIQLSNYTINGELKGPNTQQATLHMDLQDATTAYIKLSVKEGNIPGISLLPLLEHVQSSVQSFIKLPFKQQLIESNLIIASELSEWKTQANTHQSLSTPFTLLEATATLDKGILSNQDLKLTQKNLSISGHGTINLLEGSLDYHALAQLNTDPANAEPTKDKQTQDLQHFFTNTPLSITLRGSLEEPIIQPELSAYFQSAVKQLIPQVPEKSTQAAQPIKTYENLFETQH